MVPFSRSDSNSSTGSSSNLSIGSALAAGTSGSTARGLSLVPEKATLSHSIRSTVSAQFWGSSIASSSSPDGAVAAAVSEPAALPLLSGSGLSRPHLVLAAQAVKLPNKPSIPGFPSLCQDQGGLVLDRVLFHRCGEAGWAALSGRARLGRLAGQRADLVSALADPASYGLCLNTRSSLGRSCVVRSRAEWNPPPAAAPSSPTASSSSRRRRSPRRRGGAASQPSSSPAGALASAAAPSAAASHTRTPLAALTALSAACQLRSSLRAAGGAELRADVAINQRAAWAAAAAPETQGSAGDAAAATVLTPLTIGVQAGTAVGSRAPLVWRAGVLQVTAPATVPLAGVEAAAGGDRPRAPLQSGVYAQGTVAVQGERTLWQAGPARPPPPRRAAAAAPQPASHASTPPGPSPSARPPPAPVPAQPPAHRAPGLPPAVRSQGAAGMADSEDTESSGSEGLEGVEPAHPAAAATGPAAGRRRLGGGAAASGAGSVLAGALSGGAAAGGGGAPFGVVLPDAVGVQEGLVDVTHVISRVRDEVTEAAVWVRDGGLVDSLQGGAAGGGGAGGRAGPLAARQGAPWSAFVGRPHVKVAGVAGLTARAPVLLVTHGSAGAATAPPAVQHAGSDRAAWVQTLGLRRLWRRAAGAGGGSGSDEEGSVAGGAASGGPGPGGCLRPFASGAVEVQAGRFNRWLADFTRVSAKLDVGLWGPHVAAAAASDATNGPMAAPRQRHPAFALADTGAWHSLTLSACQQLFGPLRLVADWRYELASSVPLSLPPLPPPAAPPSPSRRRTAAEGGAAAAGGVLGAAAWVPGAFTALAAHVGAVRPVLTDAVYGLDLAVPGGGGAARVVAWYCPGRREGMLELRLF